MITKRIIACLDVRDGRVVKGVQFVDLIDAGDPATQAARHAAKEPTKLCCSTLPQRMKAGRRCSTQCAVPRASYSFPFA